GTGTVAHRPDRPERIARMGRPPERDTGADARPPQGQETGRALGGAGERSADRADACSLPRPGGSRARSRLADPWAAGTPLPLTAAQRPYPEPGARSLLVYARRARVVFDSPGPGFRRT